MQTCPLLGQRRQPKKATHCMSSTTMILWKGKKITAGTTERFLGQ
jgi:hypothetical protein